MKALHTKCGTMERTRPFFSTDFPKVSGLHKKFYRTEVPEKHMRAPVQTPVIESSIPASKTSESNTSYASVNSKMMREQLEVLSFMDLTMSSAIGICQAPWESNANERMQEYIRRSGDAISHAIALCCRVVANE